jgi:hypothetical protein
VNHTRVSTVILVIALGGVSGAFLETALASGGQPIVIPPITLPIALVAIGILIVLLALPIRRAVKGTRAAPVDPFYATRVVMLAKACAISGAFLLGIGVGIGAYLVARSADLLTDPVGLAAATAAGAGILLAAGLVAERMCKIPPDAGEGKPGEESAHVRP